MEQQLLAELNGRLAAEFGRNDFGEPNYKWSLTQDLGGFEKKDHAEPRLIVSATGEKLWAVESRFERFTVADIVGPNRWALAKWTYLRRGEWLALFGTSWPFPARGEYHMVGSPMLDGEEPCHKVTEAISYHLKRHLAMTLEEHEQDALVRLEEKKRIESGPVQDEIHDSFFAFDHLPGAKDYVSLPNREYRKNFQETNEQDHCEHLADAGVGVPRPAHAEESI
jgi:hypothetical protein